MPRRTPYDSTVAARTTAASQILDTPDLLAKYEALGGKALDLKTIRDAGLAAAAANMGQGLAAGSGEGATAEVVTSFFSLRKEYSAVMAAVTAAREDLEEAAASPDLLARLDQIRENDAEKTLRKEAEAEGKKFLRASMSHEAVRAEIEKDAGALIEFKEVHAVLEGRKVDLKRLTALKASASALSGKLGEQTKKKGAAEEATKKEYAAVAKQSRRWTGSRHLLFALGRLDERAGSLVKKGAR